MDFRVEWEDSGRSAFRYRHFGRAEGSDAFLLRLPGYNVLWDTGYAWYGRALARQVQEALDGERLDYILLSHSHYDHAGGAPYVKERWPEARVVAGEHAAAVFEKASARQKMRELDDFVARQQGWPLCDEVFDALRADIAVEDGDELTLGAVTVRALAFPGHTRDCVGYYFPAQKLLLGCETLGVPTGGDHVSLAMLVGEKPVSASLRRALTLDVEQLMLSHRGMLYGEDCRAFFEAGLHWAAELKRAVLRSLDAGESREALTETVAGLIWGNAAPDESQRKALWLNAGLTADAIARENA